MESEAHNQEDLKYNLRERDGKNLKFTFSEAEDFEGLDDYILESTQEQITNPTQVRGNLPPGSPGKTMRLKPKRPLREKEFGKRTKKRKNNHAKRESGLDSKADDSSLGRWTVEEHHKFIRGKSISNISALHLYGKNWKKVVEFIGTRSGPQIRSHAQKFFKKVQKESTQNVFDYVAQKANEIEKLEGSSPAEPAVLASPLQKDVALLGISQHSTGIGASPPEPEAPPKPGQVAQSSDPQLSSLVK